MEISFVLHNTKGSKDLSFTDDPSEPSDSDNIYVYLAEVVDGKQERRFLGYCKRENFKRLAKAL